MMKMLLASHRRLLLGLQYFCLIASIFLSCGSADVSNSHQSTAESKEEKKKHSCGLWIAPSTIPNAGLGIFNGDVNLPEGVSYGLDQDQIAIPLVDVEFMNGYFTGQHELGNHWREYLMNLFIDPTDFGLDQHFPHDTHFFAPGTGALANCHFALNNVYEPKSLLIDSLDMHRSKDPGVGAFSNYHGYHTPTSRPIPAYAELFGSYGEHWFKEREGTIGVVPMKRDWKRAQGFLEHVYYYWRSLADNDFSANMMDHLWKIFKIEEEEEFESSIREYVTHYSHERLSKEAGDALMEIVEEAVDLEVSEIKALPPTWAQTQHILETGGSLYTFELEKSRRNQDWFHSNGWCMDRLVPGTSKIPQAGRGAFARDNFSSGDIVAHAPLVHVADKSIFNIYGIKMNHNSMTGAEWETRDEADLKGQQLMLNYCFGRSSSSFLLCPYGSSTPYINHDSKTANVRVEWAKETSWFDESCLQMTPTELLRKHSTCLAFDYIALRDIEEGEEILLDYGTDWEEAWRMHLKNWKPDPIVGDASYIQGAVLNFDKNSTVRTIQEEKDGHPYSSNIRLECFHGEHRKWFMCNVIERKNAGNNHGFVYEVEMVEEGDEEYETFDEMSFEDDAVQYSIRIQEDGPAKMLAHNFPRQLIRFVDEWFSGDEFLPNAFRHEIGIPDDLFSDAWITLQTCTSATQENSDSSECRLDRSFDFVSTPSLLPGQVEPVRWSDTKTPVSKYAVRVGLDPELTNGLLSYAKELGIVDMYWDLLQNKEPMKPGDFQMFHFDEENDELLYYVNRPEKKWRSNMHWANAANEFTHEEYLKVLAAGNFDQTLDAIGKHFELDSLFIQGVSFIGVSQCEKGFIHHDMTDTGGKFFNVLFPLILVDEGPPELILRDDKSERDGLAKYELNEAIVVGDDAYHGTASCDYLSQKQGIRISASIYIADVNDQNVDEIMSDTTTIFPIPEHLDWYIASKGRHWGATSTLKNDKGRLSIEVKDDHSNCEVLRRQGKCESDIWETRLNCAKTCHVLMS